MNDTYWIVRYKAKGKRYAHPIVTTLRCTRSDSIRSVLARAGEDWSDIKERVGLECVKVQLIDPAPRRQTDA